MAQSDRSNGAGEGAGAANGTIDEHAAGQGGARGADGGLKGHVGYARGVQVASWQAYGRHVYGMRFARFARSKSIAFGGAACVRA
eukprot:CAMPEP_0181184358 /NCGR_PEP_ID=MMETSP1096-20121128/8923_1 /TAXON_ID=156174 ORGANISM="Chrysochromulina ericina, Strain CCMP281" /NCGR_SAMPLE_ID=MMETSP1096 /ASSEMBLY_ACC=CAM_ASM_000453 /LENGTH=84 /DNA_ID=CAMNT_0023273113 /DNA_START=383 /DNA_END=637 /DNA_ORIENTATION=-